MIDERKPLTKERQPILEDVNIKNCADTNHFPSGIDLHAPIIITGVESEEVDEINEAYADILEELGNYVQNIKYEPSGNKGNCLATQCPNTK
jgi:hypothetical protein